ncbi:MAG: DUF2924 domain-containing protein [bacterium]
MTETIEELQSLPRQELIQKWKKLFKTNSPQHARKEFLIKHIVWELQAKKQGGYSAQTKKQLDKLAEKLAKKQDVNENDVKETCRQSSVFEIKSGTKLIREYKGEKHEVIALDKGFKYKDKFYKSLSAIANEITGTRWNGKIFFGVKSA